MNEKKSFIVLLNEAKEIRVKRSRHLTNEKK